MSPEVRLRENLNLDDLIKEEEVEKKWDVKEYVK